MDRHTHVAFSDDLNAFLDGSLAEPDRARITKQLAQDPALQRELAELRATARLLHELPGIAPQRSFRLGNEFAKPQSVPAQGKLLHFLPIVRSLSVAAALVFMVVAGSLFFDINGGSESDAGTTFQAQNENMGNAGETDEHAGSSDEAEDASGESSMTSRGDAASVGDDPMEDLTRVQESEDDVAQSTTSGNTIVSAAEIPGEDDDRSSWVWSSVVLGGLALVLGGLWFVLAKVGRQSGARTA